MISYDDCTKDQMHLIDQSDLHALIMLDKSIEKLANFPDADSQKVVGILQTRLGLGAIAAEMAKSGLETLRSSVSDGERQYECEAEQDDPKELASTIWCVPFTDIHINPKWFAEPDIDTRGEALIHEWLHWYECTLDLGYDPNDPNPILANMNADSWSLLVLDLYKLK
jgi:hypothetical protein